MLMVKTPTPSRGVPLPETLPGTFYVLEWNRDLEIFILHVDDESHSSYKLGNDIQIVMMRFKVWGLQELGKQTIDLAKEFGMAQGIFSGNRALAIFERVNDKKRPEPVFNSEGSSYAGYLPTLRPTT